MPVARSFARFTRCGFLRLMPDLRSMWLPKRTEAPASVRRPPLRLPARVLGGSCLEMPRGSRERADPPHSLEPPMRSSPCRPSHSPGSAAKLGHARASRGRWTHVKVPKMMFETQERILARPLHRPAPFLPTPELTVRQRKPSAKRPLSRAPWTLGWVSRDLDEHLNCTKFLNVVSTYE